MKRTILLVGIIILFLVPRSAIGQQSVEIDHIDGSYNNCSFPTLIDGAYVQFYLRVTNLNGSACSYDPTLTFRIYSPDGAQWSDLSLDTVVGTSSIFDDANYWQGALTGSVADTVGISLLSGTGPGLTDGSEEVLLVLGFLIGASDGSTICLDTASVSGGFDWSWTGLDGCDDIVSDWGGPYCYQISTPPDMPPVWFVDSPVVISGNYCELFSFDFDAVAPDPGSGPGNISFHLIQGPGIIDTATGVWSWDGVSGMIDAGDTILVVEALPPCKEDQPAVATVALSINNESNQAPYFSSGCRVQVLAPRDVQTSFTLTGYDNCPLDVVTAELIQMDAVGDITIEGTTITFLPDIADSGLITVRVVATDGLDTADEWCEVYFKIFECDGCTSCCGVYTNGYTGNLNMDDSGKRSLADLTKLIDHIYISKSPLPCPANANLNGDSEGKINLADITRFIDHMYVSKQRTALCQ